ncbi:MAG: hypothetical protein LBO74_07855 [Candidatus Symbiothrix sp.]|jgi:hypothetical protein|nr:hypothetical protein [Candidatus Symbiothrix sp.]
MGFIREPKGVDFIINSEPLTDKEKQDISRYIKDYKLKMAELKHEKGKFTTPRDFPMNAIYAK